MTRLESGALKVKKEWLPIEEVIGSALTRLDEPLAGRRVETEVPDDLPLAPFDALLIEQVLVNLIENAVKYTPQGRRDHDIRVGVPGCPDRERLRSRPGHPPGR